MNLGALWDQLVDAVCRPPRDDAYTEADLVGGQRASFRLYDRKYYRQDVSLSNVRGQKLQGSHYRPCVVTSSDGRLPVVIYCHCNSGSRRDAEEILFHLLPKGITVFAFDFAGSGLSEGNYVTLGALEVDDLAAVVQYLREEGSSSTIGLWGRSMGAVTALLYSQQDPSMAGMVLDSPFSRLVDLMLELATDQQLRIPKPLIKMALAIMKRSVKKRAGFSVDKVAPLDCVGASFIPALFAHGKDDTFVSPHHSERLFQSYAGDKNFVTFQGEHNSARPDFFYDSALIFLLQALRVDELVGPQVDLAALPPGQLPHLTPRGNSIYVAASSTPSEDADGEGGRAGSSRSGSPPPASPLARAGSSLSPRQLNPPWALPRGDSGRLAAAAAADLSAQQAQQAAQQAQQQQQQRATAAQQAQQQQQQRPLGEAVGHLATLLEASRVAGADGKEEDQAGAAVFLSEEEALQMALEMSLQDARQQAQQGQQAEQGEEQSGAASDAAAAAGAAAAGLPLHLRYNQAFATSGTEGARNPLFGGTSAGDLPGNRGEEAAMLAAALAASLRDSQPAAAGEGEHTAAATGAMTGAEAPAPADVAPSQAKQPGASEAAELAHYYGRSGAAGAGAAFGAGDGGTGNEDKQKPEVGKEKKEEQGGEEVPAERASPRASGAMAGAHAGQEAAAVRQPSLQLHSALDEAAAQALAQHAQQGGGGGGGRQEAAEQAQQGP